MDGGAIRERAKSIPTEPGVYRFLSTAGSDSDDGTDPDGAPTVDLVSVEEGEVERLDAETERVLYVGKAVDLRDRIRSYADPRSRRIRRMLERADAVDVAVTDTETQALLLEANLIKRHRPRYNVRLKDDKSYPLVQLTDHDAPRIEITRDPDPGATVYGPFTNKGNLETVLKALRETFELRGCSDHKYASRSRPCLDYEMGLCSAPCTDEIDPSDYRADVERVERFFNGETGVLAGPLRTAMEQAANEANFERAAHLRDRLAIVESFHEAGGAAVRSERETGRRVDVLGTSIEGDTATVARLHAEDGQLLDRERRRLDAPAESTTQAEVLGAFIAQYYAERELPETILCPERPVHEGLTDWLDDAGVDLEVPGAGREATLVDLAMKNARTSVRDTDAPAALAEALGVDAAGRIEGFDVSHAGGSAVVGSNVVFVDGEPEKSDYRRKKLPEGNDDTDRMRRLVGWRADRALDGRDDRPDPDLLLIDGGVGQLNAALSALDERGWDVPAVALAKDEEIVVTPDGERDWATDDERLHLLQRVRDEAHRFAVQYHETLRDEVRTVLEDVPGIGPTTRRRLLRRFGSVSAVRDASEDELRQVDGVGTETAATIAHRLG